MAEVTLGIRNMGIRGESNYQLAIGRAGLGRGFGHRRTIYAELIPEPNNTHDEFAVRVDALIGRNRKPRTVGYIPAGLAPQIQPQVIAAREAGDRVILPMSIIGGTRDKPNYGVRIGENFG